jgi:hypothetical protein
MRDLFESETTPANLAARLDAHRFAAENAAS